MKTLAAILCSLLLNGCAQFTRPNVPAPPPSPGIFSASGKTVIAPQQSFTLDWTPGNWDGTAPNYEVVLWAAENLANPLANWTAIATSAPPVRVTVPLVSCGYFSIEDFYQ